MTSFTLTSITATFLFIIACIAGMQYRRIWKAEGPKWQLWLAGLIAGFCLLVLAFTPISPN